MWTALSGCRAVLCPLVPPAGSWCLSQPVLPCQGCCSSGSGGPWGGRSASAGLHCLPVASPFLSSMKAARFLPLRGSPALGWAAAVPLLSLHPGPWLGLLSPPAAISPHPLQHPSVHPSPHSPAGGLGTKGWLSPAGWGCGCPEPSPWGGTAQTGLFWAAVTPYPRET